MLTDVGPGYDHLREINAYLAANGPIPGMTIVYVDSRISPLAAAGKGAGPGDLLLRLRRVATEGRHRGGAIASPEPVRSDPSPELHRVSRAGVSVALNVPFVWGPVGGADDIPWPFSRLLVGASGLFIGRPQYSQRRAETTGVAASQCRRRRPPYLGRQREDPRYGESALVARAFQLLIETGATAHPTRAKYFTGDHPLRLVWSGQHIGRKGLPILLHALTLLLRPVDLLVLGDGPETHRWRQLSEKLGLSQRVPSAGQLDHAAAVAEMECADLLVLTSLKEEFPRGSRSCPWDSR